MDEHMTVNWDFDLRPNGPEVFFETLEDIKDWIAAEQEFWEPFITAKQPSGFIQALQSVSAQCNQAVGNRNNVQAKQTFQTQFSNTFSGGSPLIHSSLPVSKAIKNLREVDPALAQQCLEYASKRTFNSGTRNHAKAAWLVELYESGLDADGKLGSVKEALKHVHEDFSAKSSEAAKA